MSLLGQDAQWAEVSTLCFLFPINIYMEWKELGSGYHLAEPPRARTEKGSIPSCRCIEMEGSLVTLITVARTHS